MFLTRLKKGTFSESQKTERSLYGTRQRLKISGTRSVASGGAGAAPPGPVESGKSSLTVDGFVFFRLSYFDCSDL